MRKGRTDVRPHTVNLSDAAWEWLAASGNASFKISQLVEDDMKTAYTLMHVGYPVAGRPIREDEWKVLSVHASESAAWKRYEKHTAHLDGNSWDDHYKVIAPDGTVCNYQEWAFNQQVERAMRE